MLSNQEARTSSNTSSRMVSWSQSATLSKGVWQPKKINPLLRGSTPGHTSLPSGFATSSFWCMGFSWHLSASTGVSSWLLLHPGRDQHVSGQHSQCFASAFRAADLLFLAVPPEIQTALFLFRHFSIVSPQPILLSWDQLGSDAIADLSSLELGLLQAA